jgi:hypothetical protein
MTRLALAVAVAALLAAPAAAPAKEVVKAQVCGASGCYTWDWHNSRGKLALFEMSGQPTAPAPSAAPWYRLKISIGGPGVKPFTYTDAYVPSAGVFRRRAEGGGDEWAQVIEDLRPVLRNESARLEPLSAASLKGDAAPAARKPASAPPAPPEPDAGAPWGWITLAVAASAGLLLGLRRRTMSLRRLTPQ